VCGDGFIVVNEKCDDSNDNDDDGCSSKCLVESGWTCSETPSICTPICGDGITISPEECDFLNDSKCF